MSVRLKTDFRDYYDHWFEPRHSSAPQYNRFTKGGLNRLEQFETLELAGYNVVPYSQVLNLKNVLNPPKDLVVYTDLYGHCGTGKIKISTTEAIARHPGDLCSQFIETYGVWSLRHLFIGDQLVVLRSESSHTWQSNNGVVKTRILDDWQQAERPYALQNWPLVAVDLVRSVEGISYAVDLNTAPGLYGTGVENLIDARTVVKQISDYFYAHLLAFD